MVNYIQIRAYEPSAEPKADSNNHQQEVLAEDNLVPPDPIEEINDDVLSIYSEDGENNHVIE